MAAEHNENQIIRLDAKNCFVEALSDAFSIGKLHFVFSTYDLNRPAGQRQTNFIPIYIGIEELIELCRMLMCGEFRFIMQEKKKKSDFSPIFQHLGGTSATKLSAQGRARSDGMSLSRTAQIVCGTKADIIFIADSGPGEENEKGLIVPRFGRNPENHVAVSMKFQSLSEMLLLSKTHYEAWLSAWYMMKSTAKQ